MSIKETITTTIQEVATQHEKTLAPITDDLGLFESGLDSLCWAVVVARLEDSLGVDPFATAEGFPVTMGDFITMYENAVAVSKDAAE
jgi:acyl carrier protein